MSLVRFLDNVFLISKNRGFLWESAWESFRPIDSVRWTGETFEIVDTSFCTDPTSALWGYGSESMKSACAQLTQAYAPHVPAARPVSTLVFGPVEWFNDRHVVLSPCAPRDNASWKRMCHDRVRTRRAGPRNKFTKRNLLH